MALLILPILNVGGLQLFYPENTLDGERVKPRSFQMGKAILIIYCILTLSCTALLKLCGMPFFTAFCYGVGTVSTSGLPLTQNTTNYFYDDYMPWVMSIFMLLSAFPLLSFSFLREGKFKKIFQDEQIKTYLKLVIIISILYATLLYYSSTHTILQSVKSSFFYSTSMLTTTGFDVEYNHPSSDVFLSILGLIGGCTGSTSGGLKILRLIVLFRLTKSHIQQMIRPHGVFIPSYNKKTLTPSIINSIYILLVFYILFFVLFTFLFCVLGLKVNYAVDISINMLSNTGTRFYPIHEIPNLQAVKALMNMAMFLGRLEFATLIAVLTPAFWRR